MEVNPATERVDRRMTDDESVAKACKTIKSWLASNPPTPTTPAFHAHNEEEEQVFSPSADHSNLAQWNTNEGVSLLTAENMASRCAQLTDTPRVFFSPSTRSKTNRSKSSWSVSDDPLNNGSDENQAEEMASDELGTNSIVRWLHKTYESPIVTLPLSVIAAYQYDIDMLTGDLLEEAKYPETLQDHHLGLCRDYKDIAWRQANMTSELQIIRELKSRAQLAAKLRAHLQSKPATPTQLPAPAPVAEEDLTSWPNAECKIRPASPDDFKAIAEIINLESHATNCPQVFESNKVTASDVEKIYTSCRENMRPFIVATEKGDELFDRNKWPKNADKAYEEWLKFKRSQATAPDAIFGFAFVCDTRIGLLDTACPGSRFTGQVRLFVHPNHRPKLYGSALLDRALLSVAPYHRSLVDYVWDCPNTGLIYETLAGYNRRQYAWVYIEMFSTHKRDEGSKWKQDFLEKFGFSQMGHFPQAVKTDRCYESRWLDLSIWAVEAQPRSSIADREPGWWIES